jgi:hypothetical protein
MLPRTHNELLQLAQATADYIESEHPIQRTTTG